MSIEFKVTDASCGHCKQTIETAVRSIPAVTGADLDLNSKLLTVRHDVDVDVGQLTAAIREAGYTPELVS